MILYALVALLGGYWVLTGTWLLVSGVLDLLRIALFGYPGDKYKDD